MIQFIRMRPGLLLRAIIAVAGLTLAAPASSFAHDTLANVNTDNVYRGFVGKQGTHVVPWVRTFFLEASRCAKFEIDSQMTPLEMVVVATNPSRHFRNTIGPSPTMTSCANCAIVRIPQTPFATGYYTVQVSPADGSKTSGEFLLRLSVKDQLDPMCTPATAEF